MSLKHILPYRINHYKELFINQFEKGAQYHQSAVEKFCDIIEKDSRIDFENSFICPSLKSFSPELGGWDDIDIVVFLAFKSGAKQEGVSFKNVLLLIEVKGCDLTLTTDGIYGNYPNKQKALFTLDKGKQSAYQLLNSRFRTEERILQKVGFKKGFFIYPLILAFNNELFSKTIDEKAPKYKNYLLFDHAFSSLDHLLNKVIGQRNLRSNYEACRRQAVDSLPENFYEDEVASIFEEKEVPTLRDEPLIKELNKITELSLKDKLMKHVQKIEDVKNTLITGGAGTGKTYLIFELAIYFLVVKNKSIQIFTFNKSLAKEINRMVKIYLGQLSERYEDESIKKILHRENSFAVNISKVKDPELIKKAEIIFIDEFQDWKESEFKFIQDNRSNLSKLVAVRSLDQVLYPSSPRIDWNNFFHDEITLHKNYRNYDDIRRFSSKVRKYLGRCHSEGVVAPQMDTIFERSLNSEESFHTKEPGEIIFLHDNDLEKYIQKINAKKDSLKAHYGDILLINPKVDVETNPVWRDKNNKIISYVNMSKDELRQNSNQIRTSEYTTCRGLEGVITICRLADLQYEKIKSYYFHQEKAYQSVGVKSHFELAASFFGIAFSRAINTLIITYNDEDTWIIKKMEQYFHEIYERSKAA